MEKHLFDSENSMTLSDFQTSSCSFISLKCVCLIIVFVLKFKFDESAQELMRFHRGVRKFLSSLNPFYLFICLIEMYIL